MEDFVFKSSSVCYWTIQNYRKHGEKFSPTFSFVGCKWRLAFISFSDNFGDSGEAIQFVLECLSDSKEVSHVTCETSINEYYCCFKKNHKVGPLSKDCCTVFVYRVADILKYTSQAQILFKIQLTPVSRSNESLEEQKRHEILERIPCMISLVEDIGSLYNNRKQSDYELKCGHLTLPVHKAILSARCDYFAALFRSPMKASDKKYVEFQNIDPDSLQHVIRYFYTGKLPKMPLVTIRKVYAVADMFLYEPLKMKCVDLMVDAFVKDDQTCPKNGAEAQKTAAVKNLPKDPKHDKELLRQLFQTREWKVLCEECPALTHEIFKPFLLGTIQI